ncbi:unnamed protein product [Ostreobium quekettii]|uniref:Uncharacterized protein n=1 Tax=Ostreobium quekettii TaxID=121088 RepID=A0A8S1ITK3_9CHLO|nr:unnamed protein product [Ostreobium quekettii]|eukprot:evm.model.scf_217.1 EVM.evm.TU.scf_217.1   scf_217:5899-6219(-)
MQSHADCHMEMLMGAGWELLPGGALALTRWPPVVDSPHRIWSAREASMGACGIVAGAYLVGFLSCRGAILMGLLELDRGDDLHGPCDWWAPCMPLHQVCILQSVNL